VHEHAWTRQVDDLEEIGNLEGYIDRSSTILINISKGYCQSKNCMRELVATTTKQKPTIALTDPEALYGGLSLKKVKEQLLEAEGSYAKWNFDALATPNGQALYDHLFLAEPIEWNRIGIFQDVTMRLIAERLLKDADGKTYVDGELVSRKTIALPPPKHKHKYHVCCSKANPGALALMEELSRTHGFELKWPKDSERRSSGQGRFFQEISSEWLGFSREVFSSARRRLTLSQKKEAPGLRMTTNVDCLEECDHLLLYLTSQTWTRGEASKVLADAVLRAMDLGVHVLLAHEMPGDGEQVRFGCEFDSFFSCVDGVTPEELLRRGIYSEIAVALKGGPWREASLAMLAMAFRLSKEQSEAQAAGQEVLSQSLSVAGSQRIMRSLERAAGTFSPRRRYKTNKESRWKYTLDTSTEMQGQATADAESVNASTVDTTGETSFSKKQLSAMSVQGAVQPFAGDASGLGSGDVHKVSAQVCLPRGRLALRRQPSSAAEPTVLHVASTAIEFE